MTKKDIIYIATDRTPAKRLSLYGGYNILPNIEKLASGGTIYKNATATAGSTLMCHSSEWIGDYTWNHKSKVSHSKRLYDTAYSKRDSVFSDFEKMGYDTHIILLKRIHKVTGRKKYFYEYKQTAPLWPKSTQIHTYWDWDMPDAEKDFNREKHILKIVDALNISRKRNRPAFIWLKIHGCYSGRMSKYINYAGQYRVTDNCTYNAENDDAIGSLMKELGYGVSDDFPEIWFASDHGKFEGELFKYNYGYHLEQEIVHVPIICSSRVHNQSVVDNVFSMKEVRRLLTRNNKIGIPGQKLDEKYIFAETLYPGQTPIGPKKGNRSLAKIMVRKGKYKYIYNPFGTYGDLSNSTEDLYDLEFDPEEKINLAQMFTRHFRDVAREVSKPSDIFAKDHYTRYSEGGVKTGARDGFFEIKNLILELRDQAYKIWNKTGRGAYFKPPKI